MRARNLLYLTGLVSLLSGCEVLVRDPYVQQYPPRPAVAPWVDLTMTVQERQIIQGYVARCCSEDKEEEKRWHGRGKKHKPLPPGLARKLARGGELPPGWQKKLAKGQIMPVEIYQQCQPLPREVVVQLPPPPPGTILAAIEGKVVRLLVATREILDVFEVSY